MKAIVKEKDGIFLRDLPIPKLRNSEALIKVAVAGYCRTDTYVAQGKIKVKTPVVLGHEFSGTVEKIGKKVRGFKKGDRVAVMPILPNTEGYYLGSMLGVDRNGAFAEYVSVPAVSIHNVPDKLSFKKAAYLEPIAASIAVTKAPIKKNQKGFVLGNDRIAKLTYRILRTYEFKFTRMIPSNHLKNVPDNSYDFAIETFATTQNLSEMTRIVRPGGVIVLKSRQYTPVEISVGTIVRKELRLYGTYYGNFVEAINLLMSGKLKIDDILGPVFNLGEAAKILKGRVDRHKDKKIFFEP